MHSTNYSNAFISVADDCPAATSTVPPDREVPTIARLQYEMMIQDPYRYTSDEILFSVHVRRKQVPPTDLEAARQMYFSKGQACLRSSPLVKQYGWGIHHDPNSRVALIPREADAYQRLAQDPNIRQVKAMKNRR